MPRSPVTQTTDRADPAEVAMAVFGDDAKALARRNARSQFDVLRRPLDHVHDDGLELLRQVRVFEADIDALEDVEDGDRRTSPDLYGSPTRSANRARMTSSCVSRLPRTTMPRTSTCSPSEMSKRTRARDES